MRVLTILAITAFGCGPATPEVVAPTPVRGTADPEVSEGPLCEFAGDDWTIALSTENGIGYANVESATGRGRLERSGNEFVFVGDVEKSGWRLRTHDHPNNNALFRVSASTRFGHVLTALAGTDVLVASADPGVVETELPTDVLERASIRLVNRVTSRVGCSDLTLSNPGSSTPPQVTGESVHLTQTVGVSAQPGLPPVLEIVTQQHPPTVHRLAVREGWTHIVRRSNGIVVEGWVESRFVEPAGEFGMGFGMGGLGARSREICVANDDLALRVRRTADGLESDVGLLVAGTPFVRLTGESNDMQVQPQSGSGVRLQGGVTLWTSARAPLECRTEAPAGILGILRGGGVTVQRVPQRPAGSIRVRVSRVRGLSGVQRGSTCTIDLTRGTNCRAEITCGPHTLFGETPRLGFFPCEYNAHPMRVVGEDTTPTDSNGGGDAAMRLDTDAGTLTMHDSSHGHIGEYELEARVIQSTPP